ncbi:MAG: Asp23/Gls24 family envelope stress response protein [Oscillospiraceae bacterium]|nr:Asp23/Gls24 family envelope stress response protein [Oscillospiraceae bacterium]
MSENKGYIRYNQERGSVNISDEVVAIIAAVAAIDVEGVHGLFVSPGKEQTKMVGKKGLSRGVKLTNTGEEITVDVHVIVNMGVPVAEVGVEVQRAVAAAIEAAVGFTVSEVNVHICGIALK